MINASTDVTIRSVDIDGDGFYEHNLDCVWQIIATENRIIAIQIISFDVEQSVGSNCYDLLEVGH